MMDHRSVSFRTGPHLGSRLKSSRSLKELTDGASITCCGKEFQLLTTLWEKKNFLASSLQCLLYNFRLWPLVCRLESANWKKVSLSTLSFPDKILKVSIRSPLILRLFSVVTASPNTLNI